MRSHAVVIGGGVGGLLVAHALAGRYQAVTVLERYRYPVDLEGPAPPARRGVPQSRCLHLLMGAGVEAFDSVAPGWRELAVDRGATPFDALADVASRLPSGWLPRVASGVNTYACSRALLEEVLRLGLNGREGLRVLESHRVLGLEGDSRGDRVTGVRVSDGSGGTLATLPADLVVDATGRGSPLPSWLSRLGAGPREPVAETVVESDWHYVSRWVRVAPGRAPDWHCLSIAPGADGEVGAQGSLRSAMMLRAEGNRWGVVLLAPVGDPLPVEEQAFRDFLRGLGDGELRDVLVDAEPLSPIHRFGSTANRVRHYERLERWPSGLVALGDSVCALDPYYGLGMTVTARGVALLESRLDGLARGHGGEPERGYQEELAALNEQPWSLATGRDTDGRPLSRDSEHLRRLYRSAPKDPAVARALVEVQHLLRPLDTLAQSSPA